MGFDVTYHPVDEAGLHRFYFSLLSGEVTVAQRCQEFTIDPIFQEKLEGFVAEDRNLEVGTRFDSTLGWHAAAAAGIFARFHYLRNAMLSNLPGIEAYTKPWQEIMPSASEVFTFDNRITENYSSGVFIPPEQIAPLRSALTDGTLSPDDVAKNFPGNQLNILLTAFDEAVSSILDCSKRARSSSRIRSTSTKPKVLRTGSIVILLARSCTEKRSWIRSMIRTSNRLLKRDAYNALSSKNQRRRRLRRPRKAQMRLARSI